MDWHAVAREAIARGSQQRVAELATALEILSRRPIRRILEIGVHDAGSFWAWSHLLAPGGSIVGVDLTDENVRWDNVGEVEDGRLIVVGDSTDAGTKETVLAALGEPIDFLFIDGDHAREAVVADYEFWSPHVAADGAVGFHDVAVAASHGWEDVLRAEDPSEHLVLRIVRQDDDPQRMGIGLLLRGTPG